MPNQISRIMDFHGRVRHMRRGRAIFSQSHASQPQNQVAELGPKVAINSPSVNPQTKVREEISNILFPTNFDQKFRPAFEKVIALARGLGAKVTLFYKEPLYPMEELSPELFNFIEQDVAKFKKIAAEWQNWSDSQNVRVDYHIDLMPGSVSDEIVNFGSKKNFDLIALVSQTEKFASPRAGSLCRKVVRNSICPVWVMKTDDLTCG